MARINTNVSSLVANTNLAKSQAALNTSLQRLSSGMRINSGADDPAGLIASERLKSEIQGISTAIDNGTRATNVITTADGALSEVSNLLVSIKGLVVQAANTGGMSQDEIDANQLQVDSAIASITRISNSTSFAGLNLLNGSLGYITSGVATSALHDVHIYGAAFGTQATIPVVVNVLQSAQPATMRFNASAIATSVTLEIAGSVGVQVMSFVSGTKASAIAFAINRVSDSTGVSAAMTSATNASSGITFTTLGYGSKQFISVSVLGDSSAFVTTDAQGAAENRATGRDVTASVNGAAAIGNGLNISVNTPALTMSMNIDAGLGTGTKSFTITGGGALFQLGPQVQSNQQVSIAIDSVSASRLGDASDGYLTDVTTGGSANLSKDPGRASRIIDAAINQVSELRGRLGAFEQNTLQTNINSLQVAMENVSSSESTIEDTDFAQETANLTRNQILVQAGTSVLATANQTPQSVLKLLGG
ncbi:MAG TPA: flagellin [Phycisphaerae bacterium]|nr:flagellin [Phycisphaerae bacterium]